MTPPSRPRIVVQGRDSASSGPGRRHRLTCRSRCRRQPLGPALRLRHSFGGSALDQIFRHALTAQRAGKVGLADDESEQLLYRLFAHATRPEFTYRHQWDLDDLVMWDNRSVMHYAIGDYDETRIMHRIVVKGGKPR